MAHQKYLIIHGHFYQPPRENPWLEVIERQESAAPFPNWNERITAECYKANTLSRTLDAAGRILDVVNNFKYLSFNVGPTLLNWLEEHHPATYDAILAADRESQSMNGGHGNAIAQVYNHIIMPLATRREQAIQILAGKNDFIRHYRREPESLWLAETAIHPSTVELLIEHGLRYVILSPYQALRVRRIGDEHWKDAAHGSIDTSQPYRLFASNGHLDVFFFNKPLSTAVAFEHLLRDAHRFGERIAAAYGHGESPKLLTLCTDGESYGHHEPFGDMCLATLFANVAEKYGLRTTNYGYYLEKFPPVMEVELSAGENGEGTSWSCAHGVGRWQRDCGCSTGGGPGWNQKWRAPLRRGLRRLKEELDKGFEEEMRGRFPDPWSLLVDFISIRKRRDPHDAADLLARRENGPLSDADRKRVLHLLESQRNGHLMFTSCGWFFDDISGLEPLQNLKYAARAVELFGEPRLREILVTELEQATSNRGGETGRSLYERHIDPLLKTYDLIANHAAMETALLDKGSGLYFFYEVEIRNKEQFENFGLVLGDMELRDPFLGLNKKYFFFCAQSEEFFLQTWLAGDPDPGTRSTLMGELTNWARGQSADSAVEIAKRHALAVYGLSDLLEFHREEMLKKAMARGFKDLKESALNFYHKNESLIGQMLRFGLDLPHEVRLAVSYSVHHHIKAEMAYLKRETDPKKFERIIQWIHYAQALRIVLKLDFEKKALADTLIEKVREVIRRQDLSALRDVKDLMDIIAALGFQVEPAHVQNLLLQYLKGPFFTFAGELKKTRHEEGLSFVRELLELAENKFGINVERYRKTLKG